VGRALAEDGAKPTSGKAAPCSSSLWRPLLPDSRLIHIQPLHIHHVDHKPGGPIWAVKPSQGPPSLKWLS
jgi:hypothetical protein